MQKVNRRVVLKERPRYLLPTAPLFRMESTAVPEAGANQVLIRTLWLGMDPYLFSRVKQVSPQAKPVPLGGVMYGATVGRVEVSNRPDFAVGDLVSGLWGWQDYAVSDGSGISRIDGDIPKPSYLLGALGAAGFGAYLAVVDVLRVQAGETLTLGAALGGMGQIAGQIGKLKGARVVGVAGGKEKCRIAVEQLGFDACIDHKADDYAEQLAAAYPKGVDAFVVNTGGRMFDLALPHMNLRGRVAVCGLMENYAMTSLPSGPDRTFLLLNQMLLKRLEVRGSMVLDHLRSSRYDDFKREMKAWILGGQVKPLEHVTEGLENAPDALQGIFEGRNVGKSIVRVAA